jgi:hypothetical protein
VHTRRASAVQLNTCVRISELTLVEQRAQIDQVVRVEVGGATGLAFDEIAQVARIAPRLLLEVREEYAVAIALAQLPVVRRRNCEAAARDGGLALCRRSSHRLPRRLVCLVHSQNRGHDYGSQQGEYQSRGEHRWIKRVRELAALILALLASIIVASVLAVYQAYQSTRKAVRAAAAEREASMYCNDSICYGISGSHSCLLLIFLLIILSEEGVPYL